MNVITSTRVIISGKEEPAGLVIEHGRIREIISRDEALQKPETEDFKNLVIMPGITDAHVHINEPGRTDWEGFESATKAAAAGGITALADMPLNSSPVTTNVANLKLKTTASDGKRWIDCAFYGGIIPGNKQEIGPLCEAGVSGVKAFLCHSGIDEFPNVNREDLETAMPVLAEKKVPLLVHAELVDLDFPAIKNEKSYQQYLASRPDRWEMNAIHMMIDLCEKTGCQLHIVHLASAEALPMITKAKSAGLPLTVETAPHYLYFCNEDIPDGGTLFKCAPPIRSDTNRHKLRQALLDGIIDFVATDHSPSPTEMKKLETGSFKLAWGGISSLQLLLPALWTSMHPFGATPANICKWLCEKPAAFLSVNNKSGFISQGAEANFVIWDPESDFRVDAQKLFHRHPVTPYHGKKLSGVVRQTILRGETIFKDGHHEGGPSGRILLR